MTEEKLSTGRQFFRHVRSRLLSGLLILVPAGVTFLVLRLLFNLLFVLVRPLSDFRIGRLPAESITVLAMGILVLLVYLLGVLTTRVFGRKLVALLEWVILRVPIVKSIYGASKQVIETIRVSNRRSFKAVAVIQFPKEGSYSLAFVTGELEDQAGGRMVSVYVPTTPNPTSGYLLILRESEVFRTGLTVEEGIKMIISGGVLIPPRLDVPGVSAPGPKSAATEGTEGAPVTRNPCMTNPETVEPQPQTRKEIPMHIHTYATAEEAGVAAARDGAAFIRASVQDQGKADIIVATGASQFLMLEALIREPDIAWDRVTIFHLDEYVGLPITHPASFRRYLWERFHSKLPLPVKAFHYINGETDPSAECVRVGALIRAASIDVCFAGIGENAHLAFNDPPADVETEEPYLVVNLDEACRRQQFGEGWFPTLDDVPKQAISMSIRQLLKSRHILCTIPDERKAEAVRKCVEGEVTPETPASFLQTHGHTALYLDAAAASRLSA